MIPGTTLLVRWALRFSLLALVAANGSPSDSGFVAGRDRQRLVKILTDAHVLQSNRVLVHLSQTCNLEISRTWYPVIDVRELVPGASFAHGINQIVILDSQSHVQQSFQYVDQRPLFCSGNELHTLGVLKVNQVDPGGNVLVFDSPKGQPSYKTVDDNTVRKAPVQ